MKRKSSYFILSKLDCRCIQRCYSTSIKKCKEYVERCVSLQRNVNNVEIERGISVCAKEIMMQNRGMKEKKVLVYNITSYYTHRLSM